MKIFEENCYSSKVNFVDRNNVFVGFDNYGQCYEDFGWKIKTILPSHFGAATDDSNEFSGDLEPYVFDVNFFGDADLRINNSNSEDDYIYHREEERTAIFRLYKGEDPEFEPIYLILYNSHNGYYSHGFKMKVGGVMFNSESWYGDVKDGKLIKEGSL